MYHLLKGLHTHLTRKDEYSVVIIGLDNVGGISPRRGEGFLAMKRHLTDDQRREKRYVLASFRTTSLGDSVLMS
jgi:hypothetical protein